MLKDWCGSLFFKTYIQIMDVKKQWRGQYSVMWSEKIFLTNQQDVDLQPWNRYRRSLSG